MSKGRQDAIAREARRDRVLDLYAGGMTVRQIAVQIGVHHATVARDVQYRLDHAARDCPSTTKFRQLQRHRINLLYQRWLGPALQVDDTELSDKATGHLHRLMDREAKLFGLDAPVQREVAVTTDVQRVVIDWQDAVEDDAVNGDDDGDDEHDAGINGTDGITTVGENVVSAGVSL